MVRAFAPVPLAATLLLAACADGGDARPSILLVTLDTVRFDAIGAFGGRPGVAPVLDGLAREGVVYANARSVSPLTMPAHASMLTGLYPPRHGVRDNNVEPVPDAAETLAERALARGYRTAAFVSSIAVDSAFGFGQGFELFDEPGRATRQVLSHAGARSAADTAAAAAAWLEDPDLGRPFLLWVHLYDPHAPYEPELAFQEQAGGNAYLGEVAATDAAIGRLLAAVRAAGAWEDTLVLVVADHGEGLGDHDEATHGAFVYDATIRVPLLIRHPDGWRAGETSDEVVSVADVFPTVLEAMGAAPSPDLDGVSLYRRTVGEGRGVYFESYYGYLYYGWSPLVGWADDELTYVHGSVPRVFSVRQRNRPGRPLRRHNEEKIEPYREALRRVLAKPALDPGRSADPELLSRLQALGYAAAADVSTRLPGPFELEDLPDPHKEKAEHTQTVRAMNLARGPLNAQAIELLEDLTRANPGNVVALGRLADCYVYAERWEEAVAALQEVLQRGRAAPGVYANLGIALLATGEPERAEEALTAALAGDPDNVQALIYLAEILEQRGEVERVRELRGRIRALEGETRVEEAPEATMRGT